MKKYRYPTFERNLKAAEDLLNGAQAAGRSLSAEERAQVKTFRDRAEEAKEEQEVIDMIDRMTLGMKTSRQSGMLAPEDLDAFTKSVVAGENARMKASVTLSDAGVPGDHRPGTIGLLSEPFPLRLFAQQSTDAPLLWYRRITTGSASANTVLEGGLEPETAIVAPRSRPPSARSPCSSRRSSTTAASPSSAPSSTT